MIIDTTVQPKHIKHPHDCHLMEKARFQIVELCKDQGISLNDTYAKYYKRGIMKVWKYRDDSKSKKRINQMKKLKSRLGRLIRFCHRGIAKLSLTISPEAAAILEKANMIYNQSVLCKRAKEDYKKENKVLYSFHEPAVECIGKGKLHKPYEFGNKVGIAVSGRGNFIVGIKSFHGNPYDGHTLSEVVDEVKKVAEDPKKIFVDLGYRGNNLKSKSKVYTPYTKKSLSFADKKMMKRRSAIEPIIGHLKHFGRLGRNYLRGIIGDIINPFISAIGMNLKAIERTLSG